MKKGLGLDIWMTDTMQFEYGDCCFGPSPELRTLDSIRNSLLDHDATGPEVVYSIVMDVGKKEHKDILKERMLLFGVVGYAAGKLGREPVRSQGHIHRISSHSGWSPPEVYEVWGGKAIIYMQESADDDPGRCFSVTAEKGDVVIVPPNWAHATISADTNSPLLFGAWCDREYGFEYDKVRAHKGLAWYPLLSGNDSIEWLANECYQPSQLTKKNPRDYAEFGIEKGIPIYDQFEKDPARFQFVSKPYLKEDCWKDFVP